MWSSSIRGFRCSIDPCPRHKNDSVCWSQKPVGESRHWCWSWALHADPVGDKLLINCAQQISISSEPVPLDLNSARKVISAVGRSHYSDRSTNPNAAWDKSCKRPDKNAYCWSGLSDRLFDNSRADILHKQQHYVGIQVWSIHFAMQSLLWPWTSGVGQQDIMTLFGEGNAHDEESKQSETIT